MTADSKKVIRQKKLPKLQIKHSAVETVLASDPDRFPASCVALNLGSSADKVSRDEIEYLVSVEGKAGACGRGVSR